MALSKATDDAKSSKSSIKSSSSVVQKASMHLKKLKRKATELLSPNKKKKPTVEPAGMLLTAQNLAIDPA